MNGTWKRPKKLLENGKLNPAWKPRSNGGRPRNIEGRPHRRLSTLSEDGLHSSDTLFDGGRFVAFDGESIRTNDVDQEYVMLCASNGEKDYSIVKHGNERITGTEYLDFLCDVVKDNPRSIYVGFAFQYDVDMILKGLVNYEQGAALWDGDRVKIMGPKWNYKLSLIAKKRFSCSRFRKGGNDKPESSFVLYDTYGFYQSSFVHALEDNLGKDYEGLKLIAEGKGLRNSFASDDMAFMEKYCKLECRALVDLMRYLRNALEAADIRITNWYGAGAVAAALLKREGVKEHIVSLPDARILHACKVGFSGGHIELFKLGRTTGTVYDYDINSAYPNAARLLPPMSNGHWEHRGAGKIGYEPLAVYHVVWKGKGSLIPPFPCRYPNLGVRYVEPIETWIWSPELIAVLEVCGPEGLEIVESYAWVGYSGEGPFNFVPALYRQRRIWKNEGNGAQLPLKLGLNSIYGKLIQRVGGGVDRAEQFLARAEGRTAKRIRPTFFSLPYAGFITSYTRAMLYRAAMQKPDKIIMMMTDGIYSEEPLDLPLGDELGEWTLTKYEGGTFVQAGVYWLDGEDREDEIAHYRGYDKDSIVREGIHETWREDYLRVKKHGRRVKLPVMNTVRAQSSRHIGLGAATISGNTWHKFCQWPTLERELRIYTNEKRHMTGRMFGKEDPSAGLVQLRLKSAYVGFDEDGEPIESQEYNVSWLGDKEFVADEMVDGVPWGRIGADEYMYGRE